MANTEDENREEQKKKKKEKKPVEIPPMDLVEKEPAPPCPAGLGGWYSRAHLSAGRGARALP